MQIHELNNYNGNLDSSAYLAVDNGSDTGKISTTEFLADTNAAVSQLDTVLNGRIDNIVAGGEAPSASEIVDARYGADGVTYPSLGAAIRDQVTDLKSDLTDLKNVTVEEIIDSETVIENIFPNLTWSDGYMGASGVVDGTGSNTYRHSQVYPVSVGDVVAFENTNFTFLFITAFNGQNVVQASGQQDGYTYTVPNGIDGIVISEYVSRGTAAINHTHTVETVTYENILDDDIEYIKQTLDALEDVIQIKTYTEETTTNIYPNITWTDGKYLDLNGSEYISSSFRYSNKIPVSVGDVITYFNANFKFRFVTAYSGETAVSSSGVESSNSYTVPVGINSIVVSDYISRGDAEIDLIHSEVKKSGYVNPIPLGYMSQIGSLSAGDRLTLPYMQVKNNNRIVFNANITSFSSIKYVLGSASVQVNGTNMIITNASGTVTTVAHGLTIGSNITVIVETETEEYISHVRIASDGSAYDYGTKFYAPSVNSAQYVQSIGSTLTECVLSWVSVNVNAPIWVFGDSYISFYDERWTYYLIQDGYDKNVMFNGYAGQSSNTAYTSLANLLEITTPKQVVWCLGMNDPDTSSAVNASWKSSFDKIIKLQKKYGFELILYTVPTTPKMNNNFKNAIIRESGYRYIEADKAVRIDDDGHWVGNGTAQAALASDNVHPTTYGAKILYNRILADLPEIMCNY